MAKQTTHDLETHELDLMIPLNAKIEVTCCGPTPALRFSTEEAEELASMLKALGHPVRLQIVDVLSRYAGQMCVCDVEGQFDLSQPTISHHLKVLRQAKLIDSEQRGLWAYYFVRPEAMARLQAFLGELTPVAG